MVDWKRYLGFERNINIIVFEIRSYTPRKLPTHKNPPLLSTCGCLATPYTTPPQIKKGILRGKKLTIAEAVIAAGEDKELRFREFIEKISLQEAGNKRQREDVVDYNRSAKAAKAAAAKESQKAKQQAAKAVAAHGKTTSKGKGKGGRKGKTGGKGKLLEGILIPSDVILKSATTAGKPICFKYGADRCKSSNCRMLHVCQICEGDHMWKKCGCLH